MKISNALAIAAVNSITALIDIGAGNGKVRLYTGVQPADVSVALSGQTELGFLEFGVTAFAAAIDGTGKATAAVNAFTAGEPDAVAGTATWFRAEDGNGLAVIDGTVGTSATDMVLTNNIFSLNDTIDVSTWSIELSET